MNKPVFFAVIALLVETATAQVRPPPYEPGQELVRAVKALELRVDTLQNQANGLQGQVNTLTQQNVNQRDQIGQLRKANDALTLSHNDAVKSLNQMSRTMEQMERRMERLERGGRPNPNPPPYNPQPVIDMPVPPHNVCQFATVTQNTKVTGQPIWKTNEALTLPAGSIVEILTPSLFTWSDYPNDRALNVKVTRSSNSQAVNFVGYIDLPTIDYARCNFRR
jgi:hypothetical protein